MRFDGELPIKDNACKEALKVRERKIIKNINEAISKGWFSFTIRSEYMTDDLKNKLKNYGYKIIEKMNYNHDYMYEISWGPEEKEED